MLQQILLAVVFTAIAVLEMLQVLAAPADKCVHRILWVLLTEFGIPQDVVGRLPVGAFPLFLVAQAF